MPKTAFFTTITPLPSGITRKSVLDMYHDHLAMIDLNPLVVERFKCRPPAYAPTDEYWSTWYTIKGIFLYSYWRLHHANNNKTKYRISQAALPLGQFPTTPASTTHPRAYKHTFTHPSG
jgi:hypothetical protein